MFLRCVTSVRGRRHIHAHFKTRGFEVVSIVVMCWVFLVASTSDSVTDLWVCVHDGGVALRRAPNPTKLHFLHNVALNISNILCEETRYMPETEAADSTWTCCELQKRFPAVKPRAAAEVVGMMWHRRIPWRLYNITAQSLLLVNIL